MSSSPPPGYNPGESLLQGGTAQITPVMGGGGGMGGGPESVSLLSGGESAPIEPVRGGGRLRSAFQKRRKVRSRSRSRSCSRGSQKGGQPKGGLPLLAAGVRGSVSAAAPAAGSAPAATLVEGDIAALKNFAQKGKLEDSEIEHLSKILDNLGETKIDLKTITIDGEPDGFNTLLQVWYKIITRILNVDERNVSAPYKPLFLLLGLDQYDPEYLNSLNVYLMIKDRDSSNISQIELPFSTGIASLGNPNLLELILNKGVSPNPSHKYIPLNEAISYGLRKMVIDLLRNGAYVNQKSIDFAKDIVKEKTGTDKQTAESILKLLQTWKRSPQSEKTFTVSTSLLPEFPPTEFPLQQKILSSAPPFATLLSQYRLKQSELWRRYVKPAEEKDLPTQESAIQAILRQTSILCPKTVSGGDDIAEVGGFDRLVEFVPSSIKTFYIFNKINGNLAQFKSAIEQVVKTDSNTTTAVFLPPLYGTDRKENLEILKLFLAVKHTYSYIYAPPRHTKLYQLRGCTLDPNWETGTQNPSDPIISFLEPTYIIYLPMVATKFKEKTEVTQKLGFGITSSQTAFLPKPKNFPDIEYLSISDLKLIRYIGRGVAIPSLYDGNLTEKDPISDSLKFFSPSNYQGLNIRQYFKLDLDAPTEAKPTLNMIMEDRFRAAPELDPNPYPLHMLHPVHLGKIYYLRDPDMVPETLDDWALLRFTPDEAAFLRDLKLTPRVLKAAFDFNLPFVKELEGRSGFSQKPWQDHLMNFLKIVIDSKCFSDRTLMMESECEQARIFIDVVYQYLRFTEGDFAKQSQKDQAEINALLDIVGEQDALLKQKEIVERERDLDEILKKAAGEKMYPKFKVRNPFMVGDMIHKDQATTMDPQFRYPTLVKAIFHSTVNPSPIEIIVEGYPKKDPTTGESLEDRLAVLTENYKQDPNSTEWWSFENPASI